MILCNESLSNGSPGVGMAPVCKRRKKALRIDMLVFHHNGEIEFCIGSPLNSYVCLTKGQEV